MCRPEIRNLLMVEAAPHTRPLRSIHARQITAIPKAGCCVAHNGESYAALNRNL